MQAKLVKQCFILVALCVSVAACTNSRLILRPLYNQLDNRIEDPLLEHASFDQAQTRQIRDLIDHFHVWHRQTQLDGYARLLDDLVRHQKDGVEVTQEDITRWGDVVQDYRETVFSCNPFYSAAPIMTSLSDEQIVAIKEHREARAERRRQARLEEQEDEIDDDDFDLADTVDGRVAQIRRYLGFIGFDMNDEQARDLGETMNSTIRPETSFREIRERFDAEFEVLMERRVDPNFTDLLVDYIDRRRQANNERWDAPRKHNRGVWEDYFMRTMQGLSDEQKRAASKYLGGLSKTLKGLAADQPSYTKRGANEYACLGQKI